jgi:hypothetical protein
MLNSDEQASKNRTPFKNIANLPQAYQQEMKLIEGAAGSLKRK